ncbi:hypothetical protein [Flavobacterium pedocola]
MKKIIVIVCSFLFVYCTNKENHKEPETTETAEITETAAVEVEAGLAFLPSVDSTDQKEGPIKISRNLYAAIADYEDKENTTIVKAVYGKLNYDSLEDVAVVLQYGDEENPKKETILVFLKNNNNGFDLLAANESIISEPHFKSDYTSHTIDGKSISIRNHKLDIELFCTGGCANTTLEFLYKDDKLALKEFSEYASGAGSQTEFGYSTKSDTVTISVTNTMEEDMPVEETKRKLNYTNSLEFSEFNMNDFKAALE